MNTKELLNNFECNFPLIDPELHLDIPYKDLEREFFYFLDHPGRLSLYCNNNKIVKYFLQDRFYYIEKELWKDDNIKVKIIENRCKYLFKCPDELTTYDILSGFKKSGIYYGYSGFNPLLAKWFFSKYNTKICYDPCGGWGHRMLGATEIDKYIYNDLSYHTCAGVNNIKQCFDFFNCDIHNEDARTFMPIEDFDTMFTCPPYYNLETYECGDFSSRKEFDIFLDLLFDKFESKDSCVVFGIVMREDLIGNHTDYVEMIPLKMHKAEHLLKKNSEKHANEYLYVYRKP